MTGLVIADSQTAAKAAVVVAAAIINGLVAAAVVARLRRLRARRQAMHQARMVGRFRAAAFDTFPEAADQEFAEIARHFDEEGQ